MYRVFCVAALAVVTNFGASFTSLTVTFTSWVVDASDGSVAFTTRMYWLFWASLSVPTPTTLAAVVASSAGVSKSSSLTIESLPVFLSMVNLAVPPTYSVVSPFFRSGVFHQAVEQHVLVRVLGRYRIAEGTLHAPRSPRGSPVSPEHPVYCPLSSSRALKLGAAFARVSPLDGVVGHAGLRSSRRRSRCR